MTGDTLRWFGTTLIAGAFGLVALIGIIILVGNGHTVPDVLSTVAGAGAVGFFTAFGGMVGARASQNGAQVSTGQPPSGMGMH